MKKEIKDLSAFKKGATRTRDFLNKKGYAISHSDMLEAMSLFLGSKNYNTLQSELSQKSGSQQNSETVTLNSLTKDPEQDLRNYIQEVEDTEHLIKNGKHLTRETKILIGKILKCHNPQVIKYVVELAISNFYIKTIDDVLVSLQFKKEIANRIINYLNNNKYYSLTKAQEDDIRTIIIDEITGYVYIIKPNQ